jgi:hypothetical protein
MKTVETLLPSARVAIALELPPSVFGSSHTHMPAPSNGVPLGEEGALSFWAGMTLSGPAEFERTPPRARM